MNKVILLIVALVLVYGCTPKKPAIVDPCKDAPTACHGFIGDNPIEIEPCRRLVACYKWGMIAR
jgi:hypothetical protein